VQTLVKNEKKHIIYKMKNLKKQAFSLLKNNIKKGYSKNFKRDFFYLSPDSVHFHQWFWDSCFHIIVMSKFEPEIAKKEFETLISVQQKDGFIPHIIFWKWRLRDRFQKWWQKEVNSRKTNLLTAEIQPPVIGLSLLEIYKNTKDLEFVKRNIEKVKKYYTYLKEKRDPDYDGLISIITPMESGMDLCTHYDIPFGNTKHDPLKTKKHITEILTRYKEWNWDLDKIFESSLFDVEDISFNTIYCLGLYALAELYGKLDKNKQQEVEKWADSVKESMVEKCWFDDRQIYFSLFHREGSEIPMKIKTISSLFPLTLSIPEFHIKSLAGHLQSESEFWSPYPITSVAMDEPSFGPLTDTRLIWRGTTWVNTNWFLANGLEKQGYTALAKKVARKTIELIINFGFCEYYDPFDGQPGKAMRNFGWSTLAIDFIDLLNRN
jgi:glycogen debranching enzyme